MASGGAAVNVIIETYSSMRGKDIFLSILIVIVFFLLYAFAALSVGIKKVEEDWPLYRCNPAVMPLASVFGHDPAENFTYCVQNMQTDYMDYLLAPVNYNMGVLGSLGEETMQAIQSARAFISNLRGFLTDIITSVFGVFLNLLIEVQRTMVVIKDTIGKFVGILAGLLFTMDGSIRLMQSTWNGAPGAMVRALGSVCFHPDTKVKMADGSEKSMKDLELNEMLANETRVMSVLKISNLTSTGKQREGMFQYQLGKSEPVYVTGSHLVFDADEDQFVQVKESAHSEPYDMPCQVLSCLITSNHTIPIGDSIFHDWEDNNGSPSKSLA